MGTLTSLYLSSEIIAQEVVKDRLYLHSADGGRYKIPLAMLGHFRAPFAPDDDAELLILEQMPVVKSVNVTDEALIVTFADGRVLSAPLSWFPRLWHGTPAERQAVEIWGGVCLHYGSEGRSVVFARLSVSRAEVTSQVFAPVLKAA